MDIRHVTAMVALTASATVGLTTTATHASPAPAALSACQTHVGQAFRDQAAALYASRVLAATLHRDMLLAKSIGPRITPDYVGNTSTNRNQVIAALGRANLWVKLSAGMKAWIVSKIGGYRLSRVYIEYGNFKGAVGVLSVIYDPTKMEHAVYSMMDFALATRAVVNDLEEFAGVNRDDVAAETCMPVARAKIASFAHIIDGLGQQMIRDSDALFDALNRFS